MSVNFPATTTTLLVNTWTTPKVVFLPAASTIGAGKLIFIKDICGNAGKSTIFISTKGLDQIEQSFPPSTLYGFLSTNFGSVLLAPDGGTNWMVLQNYILNGVSRAAGGAFLYFSNSIFRLTNRPTGRVFSDSGGTVPATVSGNVGQWKDLNNAYNFTVGTAPTYSLLGSVNAIYFSGSSFLAGSSLALNNLSTSTRETVVYLTSVSNTAYFIAKQDNGVNSYNRFRSESGTIRWHVSNGATTISSTSAVSANQWYHIVITFNGTTCSLYINGTLNTSTGGGFTIANDDSSTNGNTLGAWTGDGNTYNANMYMAEFNAYSISLTAAEVLASYQSRRGVYGF